MDSNIHTAQTARTKKLILSALFLAIGMILPFITMQIPAIGNMLCPMHIPVLLCGFLCGTPYGLAVGFLTPLVRGVLTGFPALYPNGFSMAFELAVYGGLTGWLYPKLALKMREPKVKEPNIKDWNTKERSTKELAAIYVTLFIAMISGRVVWGAVSFVLYQIMGNVFTWQIFAAQAFANAIPGIVVQLVLIPVIVQRLQKMRKDLWN